MLGGFFVLNFYRIILLKKERARISGKKLRILCLENFTGQKAL